MGATTTRTLWRGLLLLLGLAAHITVTAQTDEFADLDAFVEEQRQAAGVPGVAIAIVRDGALVHEAAFGIADTQSGRPVTTDTPFQVGSVSKPVAAWAALRLVREGLLQLDTPVPQTLQGWTLPDSEHDSDGVTVRRLLSHTAGLSLSGYPGFPRSEPLPTVIESLEGATNGMGAVYLMQAPGEDFSYSGGGYTLLQLLIGEVTDSHFAAVAQQRVLEPLGMTSSSYRADEALLQRAARGHDVRGVVHIDYHFAAEAAASLYSTAGDLARFAIANMGDNPVLDPEQVGVMHSAISANRDWNGTGFFLDADGQIVGHGGANIGWRALLQIAPNGGDALVLLTNSDAGQRLFLDIECYWDAELGSRLLIETCARDLADRAAWRQRLEAIGWVCRVTGLGLLLTVLWRLRRGRATLSLTPGRHPRTIMAAVLAGVVGLWWLLAHTTLGVYLVTGFPFTTAVDNFGPSATMLSWSAIGALLSLALFLLARDRPGDA